MWRWHNDLIFSWFTFTVASFICSPHSKCIHIKSNISNSNSNNVTCSAPHTSHRWHIPEFTQCSWCKQHETENSPVCSWMKQSNARVSSQSAADSKHGVWQQRKPCHQSSDSFLVRPSHSYSMNAATTVKECQRRASTCWQCNRERARRTSCAQADAACTVFTLWSATNATPAKQELHLACTNSELCWLWELNAFVFFRVLQTLQC